MSETELCGLKNFNNTCWLNSSIQCFLKCDVLTNFFYSKKIRELFSKNTLLSLQWLRLVNSIKEENCIISPLSFLKAVIITANKNGYMFDFNRQNDTQEFILFFIDSLHEELKHKVNINITGKIITDLDKMAYDAMKYWKDYFKDNYSEIINIFYGQLVTHTKVIDEDINSYSYSPICVYSLPISDEKKSTIYDSFNLFCKTQVLDGDNKWKYDKTNKYYSVNQDTMIWKFPKVLIIHLKRFNNNSEKINNYIDFPIDELDLKDYCVGYEKNKSKFKLFGICNHIGRLNGGHYFSYCKKNDNWYKFDDESVSNISLENIKTQYAYCLFYQKIL